MNKTHISFFVLIICISVIASFLIPEGIRRSQGNPPEDFIQFYMQSVRLINGEDVYKTKALHDQIEKELGWGFEEVSPANPPFFILFTLPLSLIPYPLAWWSISIFSILVIFSSSFLVGKYCGYNSVASVCFGISALCFFPTVVLLILNHIESILLLFLVAGWLFFKKGKTTWGALCWAIAASIKLFPALYLIPLMNEKYRKIGIISFSAVLLMTIFGFFVIGVDQTKIFLFEIIPNSKQFYSSLGNFSILAFGNAVNSKLFGWFLTILFGIFIFKFLLEKPGSIDKIFVTATAGSLLLSPLSWSYYFVLLSPTLIVLSCYLTLDNSYDRILLYLLILMTLMWPSLFGGWINKLFDNIPNNLVLLLRYMPTYGLIFLLLLGSKRME